MAICNLYEEVEIHWCLHKCEEVGEPEQNAVVPHSPRNVNYKKKTFMKLISSNSLSTVHPYAMYRKVP